MHYSNTINNWIFITEKSFIEKSCRLYEAYYIKDIEKINKLLLQENVVKINLKLKNEST